MNDVHPTAVCESDDVASGVVIGPMAVVAAGTVIGEGAEVGAQATLARNVVLGDRSTVGAGARLGTGAEVQADARIGDNAVVDAGFVVGRQSVVEPGAYVVGNVPPKAIVRGNPATIVGYVHAPHARQDVPPPARSGDELDEIAARCSIWPLPRFSDLRGALVAMEYDRDLPFVPVRSFLVHDVPGEEVRGEHAHRWCSQLLLAAHGGLSVVVDDGTESTEVRLDRPDRGLLVPAGVWAVQYRFSSDAVLCVFASHAYDPADYIRDYEEFLRFSSSQPSSTSSG